MWQPLSEEGRKVPSELTRCCAGMGAGDAGRPEEGVPTGSSVG